MKTLLGIPNNTDHSERAEIVIRSHVLLSMGLWPGSNSTPGYSMSLWNPTRDVTQANKDLGNKFSHSKNNTYRTLTELIPYFLNQSHDNLEIPPLLS